jgi:hypothetical protein
VPPILSSIVLVVRYIQTLTVTGLEAVCGAGAHVSRATGQESIYLSRRGLVVPSV